MLAKTPLRDLAIAWLEQQKPSKQYNWAIVEHCACAQIAKAIDRYDEWAMSQSPTYSASSIEERDLWRDLNMVAYNRPRTFGGMLKRLRELEEV